MARSLALSAILLGILATPACSNKPEPIASDGETTDAFARRIDALRMEQSIPGLAVVVLRDQEVILARGFGYADVERKVPVSPDTPFDIASVTKPLSAVVALRLVESGTLDLDSPMETFDGFREFATEARGAGGIFFRDYADGPTKLTLRHVLSMSANGDPGAKFFYNPSSYSWASRAMAQAAGRPFSDLVTEHVFRPAGMTHSARFHRTRPLPAELAAGLAKPYHADESGRFVLSEPPKPQGDGAAGGVVTTAADLAKFDIALSEGRLLKPESRRLMWTAAGATRPYGLGWFVQDFNGEVFVWHSGLWEGKYSALYLKVLDRKFTLILLANSDGLRWESRLDEANVERSPFAAAFLRAFPANAERVGPEYSAPTRPWCATRRPVPRCLSHRPVASPSHFFFGFGRSGAGGSNSRFNSSGSDSTSRVT